MPTSVLLTFCNSSTLVKRSGDELSATPLRCRMWNCPHCVDGKRAELRAKAHAGKPSLFITLTVDPSLHESPDHAARAMVKAWADFRLWWSRRPRGFKLSSLQVFERHQNGWPHLHIVARGGFIPQKLLKAFWRRAGVGSIVDIRAIDGPGRIAAYVTKYVGKDPQTFEGCKRWWSSHDWLPSTWRERSEAFKAGAVFWIEAMMHHTWLDRMLQMGCRAHSEGGRTYFRCSELRSPVYALGPP